MRREYLNRILLFIVLHLTLGTTTDTTNRPCHPEDFTYRYTECDNNNQKWRVAVPNATCVGNAPSHPKVINCNFACKEGTSLNLKTESCEPCSPGTYSLGGGVVFEDFSSVPAQFTVATEKYRNRLFAESDEGFNAVSEECGGEKSGWIAKNGFLIYYPSMCISTLSYSLQLVRPGNVTFTYFFPSDEGLMFKFSVQNAQCIVDNDRQKDYLPPTGDEKFKTKSVSLNKGQTLLTWKGLAFYGGSKPLMIKRIEVIGIAYTQECTKCPPGTYSSANSKSCTPCPPGSYSSKGASKCSDCDQRTQYSGFRASKCIDRPPCTSDDYDKVYSICNEHGQATSSYQWIEPKICGESVAGAELIKHETNTVACSPCNPGMELKTTVCAFCEKGFYSDGKSGCRKCQPNSSPNYGYQFINWYSLPDKVRALCQYMDESGSECKNVTSWILSGDCIHTAFVRREDVYFTLTLTVDGFQNLFLHGEPTDRNPIGQLTFVFETKCAGPECGLYLLQLDDDPNGYGDIMISQWNGSMSKQSFSYPVTKRGSAQFQLLFIRGQMSDSGVADVNKKWMHDRVTIYSINVTNVKDVGASACIPCPVNDKNECAPCPPGHYIQAGHMKCVQCQNDTYLNITNSFGPQSCVKCGPNLKSEKGVECDTDCKFNISGRLFNLANLKGFYQAKGVQIYNGDTKYFHVFNFSVCSLEPVSCSSTISSDFSKYGKDFGAVSSLVCRSVAVPQQSSITYQTPIELGDYLLGVSDTLKFSDFEIPRNVVTPWRYSELYFLYRTGSGRTPNCPNGRSTLIVFRCDPTQNASRTELPSQCPDGTCDGCFFQIIVTSRFACPLCTKADYSEVVGQCSFGKQTVHYIPTKFCVLIGEDQLKTTVKKCDFLSVEVESVIGVAAFVGLLLLFLVVHVWKKNQKLEYKYMKLIESSAGKEGELPEVESCALNDGDEDDEGSDRVVFSKGGKRSGWFSTGNRSSNKSKNYGGGAENSALTLGGEIDDS